MQELSGSSREEKFQRKNWTNNCTITDDYCWATPTVMHVHCTRCNMADREYNVYQAKLAEQAERYDGIIQFH